MKLSQKKNCNGCRAGTINQSYTRINCALRFEAKMGKNYGIPKEPCYKPLTYKDYIEASDLISGRKI